MVDTPDPTSERQDAKARALDAAKRWTARAGKRRQRAQGVEKGEGIISDTPYRLVARVTRLRGLLAAHALAEGSAPRRVQDIITRAPKASEITDKLVERVIGETRDFLSIEFFERGLAAALCVGRIMTGGAVNGTGFLVAPDIVITNNHVLKNEGEAAESFLELDYEANTFGERKRPQCFDLDPAGFFVTDEAHDFTLVAVRSLSQENRKLSDFGHLPLIAEEGKIAVGESVNVVQHPKGRYKQIVIRNSRLVDLPEGDAADAFFHYEADTEKGSSGSPVFSDQWEVVALHHSGVPKTNAKGEMLDADGNVVETYDEDRIVWVANEGVRTSRLVKAMSEVKLANPEHHARRAGLLAKWLSESKPGAMASSLVAKEAVAKEAGAMVPKGGPVQRPPRQPEPARERRSSETSTGSIAAAGSGQTLSFAVPLRIDVAVGRTAAEGPSEAGVALASAAALQEAIRPDPDDPDYLNRPGYKTDFLGFEVALPTLADARHGPLLLFGPDRESELKYHHFSVLMNARRRLAYVAAVNLDASARYRHEREGSDRWFFDPRVPSRQQAGGPYYASNPLDRGHLVRRDDAAWGRTAREARLANDDTFHWTNCSPQHEIFNQSGLATRRGLMLWGNLENAVSDLAPTYGDRLCVFNGPVFGDGDRPYGDNFFLPEAFWKLIVLKGEDGQPRALAFQLSQTEQLKDLVSERFAPEELADFEVFQVPVSRLAQATGLDFGAVAAWDPLGARSSGRSEARESAAGASALLLRHETLIRM